MADARVDDLAGPGNPLSIRAAYSISAALDRALEAGLRPALRELVGTRVEPVDVRDGHVTRVALTPPLERLGRSGRRR